MKRQASDKIANIGAIGAGLIALAALMGYWIGDLRFAGISPAYIPMAPSTALCFLALSGVLVMRFPTDTAPILRRFRMGCVVLAFLYGLLVFTSWAIGQEQRFEGWFMPDMGMLDTIPIGRMAPVTGALFALSGLGMGSYLYASDFPFTRRRVKDLCLNMAGWMGTLVICTSGALLLGYAYGAPLMYAGHTIPLAATTVIAFILLGAAQIAVLGPTASPVRHFVGDATSARLLRVFVPLVVGTLLLQSMLTHFIPAIIVEHAVLATASLAIMVLLVTVMLTTRIARRIGNVIDTTEQQLKEAQEEFRTTLYSIGDGLITTDKSGKIKLMNPVAEALTGWTQAEAVGKPLAEVFRIINEYTRAPVENPAEQVLRHGKILDLANHTLLIARNGVERPIADSSAPIRNDVGEAQGAVLVFRDQSRERQAEQALLDNEKRYRYLFHANPHPMWIYDLETLAFLEVNQAAVDQYGYSTVEFLGMSIADIRPEEDVPRLKEAVGRVGPTGIDKAGVWRHIRKDNSVIYVDIISHALPWKGRPAELVLANDITVQLTAEQELREAKNLLENTFESLGDALFIIKNPGRIIEYCNPAATRIFGYTADEMIGQTTRMLHVDTPSYKQFGALSEEVLGKSAIFNAEYTMRHKDGAIVTAEVTVTKLKEENDRPESRVISILHDITKRKQAEAERAKLESQLLQAQKMEAVGRMAGGIAHDFNNMLGAILGHVEIALMSTGVDNPVHEDLLSIQAAAQSSSNLTRKLLAFARRQEIHLEIVNLNEAIGNMQHLLSRLIGEDVELVFNPGGVTSTVEGQTGVLWPVIMDPSQLDQVVVNLTINARDAISGAGKIVITTRNVELDEGYCALHVDAIPGQYVLLEHMDDGCGMSKETLSHIFEPFFTTKESGKGTGLGLPTVYGIVKQNKGHITVYSEPGLGCIIRIYLPAYHAAKEHATSKRDRLDPNIKLPGGNETILLVEDEETLLKLGARMLEQLGYTVYAVAHPHEAIELAEHHREHIQLLITDVVMPDMSGRELWESLQENMPTLKCLFMSGYTADIISSHGVSDEALFFLQKPFSRSELAHKIREVLSA